MKISRVTQMREMDRTAIKKYGIIDELLMENAGNACYFTIQQELPITGQRFVVVCGIGNNGGDGLVIARKLYSNGGRVTVFVLGNPERYRGSARRNFEIVRKLNLEIFLNEISDLDSRLAKADAVIDAIFGTGLTREVDGVYREVIEKINTAGKIVFSVDIPSGVNADTGQVHGIGVQANFTTTFGLPKIGNLIYPGFEKCGRLSVTHISFPPELYQQAELTVATSDPVPLPQRAGDAHKGAAGKVLFIAGAAQYLGAPYFSAYSFLKCGGGLSYLAAPKLIVPYIGGKASELVFVPQPETAAGSLALSSKRELLALAAQMKMVVLGPGLSLNAETQELVRELAAELTCPLLIDGDGLTAVAARPEVVRNRTAPTILTPHPGEMARLLNASIAEIVADRVSVLEKACQQFNATIVLKGAHTQIGVADGRVFINLSGNSGMATAGSGDLLTGVISAAYCAGLELEDAVRTGVFLHGLAGDLAAEKTGKDGWMLFA